MTESVREIDREQQMLTRLCRAADVPEQGVKQVAPPERDAEYAVYRLDGQFYATDDLCTHGLVSLSYGDVVDGIIHCPMHGGAFDIRTGKPAALPCRLPLKTYEVVVIGDELFADLN
ncbi:MAG TPA: non-heme iron oxygenase ferredoxin subunit [Caulobacteraceae bacterium]|nr:non-heme iron oxygenase ferredoxin subunit [Caulobacteraceae bacterium]